ncbi:M50 family metallopeptidase [Paenibacillus humicola]|uniref:M50 family metallopeptidase n=1 Tax=Paenibacillus humicola TaxID=3110540 RepID=UPI00237BB1BE|nr:M50 family metallopeptidase [Paenibacillus humicola]
MKWKMIAIALLVLVLLNLPVVGNFLRAANTLVHESGHALTALLFQGHVYSISLFANTEGLTYSSYTSWAGGFATGLAGYVFSSIFILALASLWSRSRYRIVPVILLVLAAANIVFWVRNAYGMIWLILFILLLVYTLVTKKKEFAFTVTAVILLVILAASVRAGFDVFMLGLQTPGQAGDATVLRQITHVPAVFWGTFFFAQSLWAAFAAGKKLLKKLNQ